MIRARGSLRLAIAATFFLVATGVDPLQSLYRTSRQATGALQEGDAERAIQLYTDAQALAPDDPRLLFNLGNALAAADRSDEAKTAWKRAAELSDDAIARDAWFNRGVSALSEQAAADVVNAFVEALMIDPSDEEARSNLEHALRMLPPPREEEQQQQAGDGESNDEQERSKEQQDPTRQQEAEESPRSSDSERSDTEDEGEQPQPGDPSDSSSEPTASPEMEAGESGGDAAPETPEREMSQRVLESLERGERESLKRALRQRFADEKKRERDW